MKNKLRILTALVLTTAFFCAGCGQTSTVSPKADTQKITASTQQAEDGTVFSNLKTTDLDGNPVDASIFKENKLTLVNAWNIGCTPCVEEIPTLDKLNREYEKKGVAIKGLYFNFAETIGDDEKKQIDAVLSDANATYQQLQLTSDMYQTSTMQEVMAFPSTFIVDSNGTILDKIEGSNDYDGWKAVIETYLAKVE